MKKYLLIVILAIFAFAGSASAESVSYKFSKPEIVKSGNYHDISLDNLPLSLEPQMPMLPFKPVMILLPQGCTADNVEVKPSEIAEIKGEYFLRPADYNLPLSFEKQLDEKKKRASLLNGGKRPEFTYNYKGNFPASIISNFSVQSARGYKILVLNINPVIYQAETGKVYYYPEITLTYNLKTLRANNNEMAVRDSDSDREYVKSIVDNPEVVKNYKTSKINRGAAVDYLIVTSKALAASTAEYNFNKFAKFLNDKGVKTEIVIVDDIFAQSTGRDNAEKLRNYLKKSYNDKGIKYVLLGGGGLESKPAVPVRKLTAGFKWDNQTFKQELPGDVYYANLDGSFDENNNGIFGEPNDGVNGGDIDMFSELAVGRVPAENAAELSNFLKKDMAAYGYFDSQEYGKVSFAGENLFPGVWGKTYMKEIETGATAHGFTTAGYPDIYTRTYLFDKDKQWSAGDMLNLLNSGIYILNHVGHSSVTSNMRLSTWSLSRLNNSKYYLLYTQGCYCGRFIESGCILAAHVTSPNGAYAAIGNSSYGLGPEDPDPDTAVTCRGASQYFHRQFTNALFTAGKNRLGDANQASKEANVKFMNHGTTRWVFFELNLLGDPYLPLKIK
ncbi:MAG: C25 family cysteine peptidase [Candidatus Wallbacteria bacterium]